MTQAQFVSYEQGGFWAYDVALGVVLKHLVDVAVERISSPPEEPWLSDAISWWRVVACVSDYGLDLGEGWTPSQTETFLELLGEARSRIASRPTFSAAEMAGWQVLDGQGIFARGASEVVTAPIVELANAIVALLTGSLSPPPPDTAWFFGAPTGRRTIAMRASSA